MTSHFALKPQDMNWGEYGRSNVVFRHIDSQLESLAEGGIWKVYFIAQLPYQWTSDREPTNEIFMVTNLDGRKIAGIYGTLSDNGSEHFRQLAGVIDHLVSECGLRRKEAIL